MDENEESIMEKIWGIRDTIRELEDVKDEIITFWNDPKRSDASPDMWISDVKDMYYAITSAWSMLKGSLKKKDYIRTSKNYLDLARSRMEQSVSELLTQKDLKSSKLEEKLREKFEGCWTEIRNILDKLSPQVSLRPPNKRIEKIDDDTYVLPCATCGKNTIVFLRRVSLISKKRKLFYASILKEYAFPLKMANKIFTWLDQGDLSKVHKYFKKSTDFEEGIDAYCPKCDKIYCSVHYQVREIFDEGFYDYTLGTCPKGHERMIDD